MKEEAKEMYGEKRELLGEIERLKAELKKCKSKCKEMAISFDTQMSTLNIVKTDNKH